MRSFRAALWTSRNPGREGIAFDLANRNIDKLVAKYRVGSVILLSAISDPTECFRYPVTSSQINVDHTIETLRTLNDLGVFSIFASSEMVFSGTQAMAKETTAPSPKLLYGIQKRRVEEFVLSEGLNTAIVRLAKVYSLSEPGYGLFLSWQKTLFQDRHPQVVASDQFFSPISDNDVDAALHSLLASQARGIFHLSSNTRISRWELLTMYARLRGYDLTEFPVRRGRLIDIHTPEALPPDLSMSSEQTQERLGVRFRTPDEALLLKSAGEV